jgi:hypothetical protein
MKSILPPKGFAVIYVDLETPGHDPTSIESLAFCSYTTTRDLGHILDRWGILSWRHEVHCFLFVS